MESKMKQHNVTGCTGTKTKPNKKDAGSSSFQITIEDDFSMEKIAASGQAFRIRPFDDGTYRFISGASVLYLRRLPGETAQETPLTLQASCDPATWKAVWAPYFDLARRYIPLRCRLQKGDDPFLARAAAGGAGLRILRQEPFETMITFILSQRKSIPAIQSCVETLCRRYGTPIRTARESLYLFPGPAQLQDASEDDLRDCRLGYRAPYVADAVRQVLSGSLDLAGAAFLSDADLLSELQKVKGIGRKVANCIALFAYGRTGLAPIDTWIGKAIQKYWHGCDPFPAYGDAAGIVQQYVFYYALTHKNAF